MSAFPRCRENGKLGFLCITSTCIWKGLEAALHEIWTEFEGVHILCLCVVCMWVL